MDNVPESQLCLLISKMLPEQFDRYVFDRECGFIIFQHIAFCTSPSCRKAFMENEKRTMAAVSREEARLSKFERWKQNLSVQALLCEMKGKGIIK